MIAPSLVPPPSETIAGMRADLRDGRRSCRDVVEDCLARIDAQEPHIRAWVVVDREVRQLLEMMREALDAEHPRMLIERSAFALLDYIEQHSDGFRILVRDSPIGSASGSYVSIINDIASRVEGILVDEFRRRGFDAKAAPMYAQMLVGMVGTTGQWWLDARKPAKEVVAAHLVNLAWNGLTGLEQKPTLRGKRS